jgi:hypothetical protein
LANHWLTRELTPKDLPKYVYRHTISLGQQTSLARQKWIKELEGSGQSMQDTAPLRLGDMTIKTTVKAVENRRKALGSGLAKAFAVAKRCQALEQVMDQAATELEVLLGESALAGLTNPSQSFEHLQYELGAQLLTDISRTTHDWSKSQATILVRLSDCTKEISSGKSTIDDLKFARIQTILDYSDQDGTEDPTQKLIINTQLSEEAIKSIKQAHMLEPFSETKLAAHDGV